MSILIHSSAAVIPVANILDQTIKQGLIPVSIFALLSVLSTSTLLTWITYRLVWRHDYRSQYVILIYNLLLGDLQQSLSFLISIHWLRLGRIDSPSTSCFAQGWLINMGDMSSGFFVLAIALHTWYSVVLGRKVSYMAFTIGILGIWIFSLLLTFLGPAIHGPHYFVRAGAWCWADAKYDLERLWLHYVWVFIIEFGTIFIYTYVFLHLRKQLSSILSVSPEHRNGNDRSKTRLSQAARYMVLYPLIYVLLTLPLAAGRMAAMSGSKLPDVYYCIAGSMMTSCGWLDSLLYTLTRRVFIRTEPSADRRSMATVHPSFRSSKRKWVSGRLRANSCAASTAPIHQIPQWPMSSFASVTVDLKEPRPQSLSDGASDITAGERNSGLHKHLISGLRSGRSTPVIATKMETSVSSAGHKKPMDPNMSMTMSMTETMIGAGDERPIVEDRILSETRIEVVSVPRDELLWDV